MEFVNLNYKDKLKKMSDKELHEEAMTYFFDITGRKKKPVSLNDEEKVQAESLFIESINRMEKNTESIELLRTCAFAIKKLIDEPHDEESNIMSWIRDWQPR